jgi:hypothetical protein
MLISAKEIINKTLELFKRDIRVWLFYIGVNFATALLGSFLIFNAKILLFFATLGISSTVMLFLNMLFVLLVTLINIWVQLALIRTIHYRLFNQEVKSIKNQFIQSKHLLPRAIAVSLLVTIIASLPFVLGVVGLGLTGFESLIHGNIKAGGLLYLFFGLLLVYGIFHSIYFSLKYVLSYYVVAIDETSVTQSLHLGSKMVTGRMPSILWRLMIPLILFLLVYIFGNYIFVAFAAWLDNRFVTSFAGLLSLFVSALVALWTIIATVILFEDAKAKPVVDLEVKKA